jgi:hypothetical protein
MTAQLALLSLLPRSCIRNQSRENLLKRTKIVLALPSYHRQRLSGIRRGWCPSHFLRKIAQGIERVIRSDSGVAHRLSSSARVLSAADSQVKMKRQRKKRLCIHHIGMLMDLKARLNHDLNRSKAQFPTLKWRPAPARKPRTQRGSTTPI